MCGFGVDSPGEIYLVGKDKLTYSGHPLLLLLSLERDRLFYHAAIFEETLQTGDMDYA